MSASDSGQDSSAMTYRLIDIGAIIPDSREFIGFRPGRVDSQHVNNLVEVCRKECPASIFEIEVANDGKGDGNAIGRCRPSSNLVHDHLQRK